jgi:tetratricopeptide (TPR) repeat protein
MVLWEIGAAGRTERGALRRWPMFAAVAASLVLLWWVRHQVFRPLPWPNPPFVDNPLIGADFWSVRLTAVKVIGMDLWLLVFPLHLSVDRSYHQIPVAGWSDVGAWLALAMVVAILAVAIARRPKDRFIFWATGFFGITLLPTSNLLFPIGSIMSERFLYLPSVGFAVAMAALAYRIPQQKWRTAVVGVVLILLAGRTYARNPAWQDDLTLASTDLSTAPRSFKLHTLLAQELVKRDVQGNIDQAIRELETAYEILRPLPDLEMPQQNLIRLGDAYLVKGNLSGGPSTAEGRGWFEKALPVLERAREISQLDEKAYDESQRAHGKPLGERFATQDLYYDLGVAYGTVGRFADALETLRYGRSINPERLDLYAALSAAYTGLMQPEGAAVALLESVLVGGERPETLASLKQLYAAIPEGACAIETSGSGLKLNPDCPRLRGELCLAHADLARAYTEARQPAKADEVKDSAIHRYACPGAAFGEK